MTGDPGAEALAADWPGWRIWRRDDGVLCAWLLGSQPPLVLYGGTAGELSAAIEDHTKGGSDAG